MNDQHNQYLAEVEVAKLTGFSLPTLRNWRCFKKGPQYLKIGKSIRYRLSDIQEFMEANIIKTEE